MKISSLGKLTLGFAATFALAAGSAFANVTPNLQDSSGAAVKDYLVSKGIPASKITTIGKGKSQPVATNKTAEGRQKNRRVDIEFKGVRQ